MTNIVKDNIIYQIQKRLQKDILLKNQRLKNKINLNQNKIQKKEKLKLHKEKFQNKNIL